MDQAAGNLSRLVLQIHNFKWLHIFLKALTMVTLAQLAEVIHASSQDLVLICHKECMLATCCYVDDFN